MSFDIGPYDPCPCGSGNKYKFCCAKAAKANRHGKYPIGTVAYYGPDDKTVTKIAAGVIFRENQPATMERWVGTNVYGDPKVADEIKRFFAKNGVKNVVLTDGIIGCPHEEGIDFPNGRECPFCPFWAGKQGIVIRDTEDDWHDLDEDDDSLLETSEENYADEEDESESRDFDAEEKRIRSILGDARTDFARAREVWVTHLNQNLTFPCQVTGIEDFRWEEPYVIGGWDAREYKQLKRTQPSYTDKYELLRLDPEAISEWMMFHDDISAKVRRISDGKEFILGLAELKACDKNSPDRELMHAFSVWLVNSR